MAIQVRILFSSLSDSCLRSSDLDPFTINLPTATLLHRRLLVDGDGTDGVRGLAAGGDEGISSTAKDVAPHVVANHPTAIITST
jgi:hypothetical protein